MDGVMTYNSAKVKIALGTHAVTGYAEDSLSLSRSAAA